MSSESIAKILEERGRVYITKQGYVAIHVYNRTPTQRFGYTQVLKGGTSDWVWARQASFKEHLPSIVGYMHNTKRRELFQAVLEWACFPQTSQIERAVGIALLRLEIKEDRLVRRVP